MAREFRDAEFDSAYDDLIVRGTLTEKGDYYPRYRSRYKEIIKEYASNVDQQPKIVLDVGGGQLALLVKRLWNDNATLADFNPEHREYIESQGVEVTSWNLCDDSQPFQGRYDVIFFSEVIEHLPIPAHVILEKLRRALRPGGTLICTTPNLYRPRNIIYMILGKEIYDTFRMPGKDGLGHVIEYSQEHLTWQFNRAGFQEISVEMRQFHHNPKSLPMRVLSWIGYPIRIVPRFRDNIIVIAKSPKEANYSFLNN